MKPIEATTLLTNVRLVVRCLPADVDIIGVADNTSGGAYIQLYNADMENVAQVLQSEVRVSNQNENTIRKSVYVGPIEVFCLEDMIKEAEG